MLGKNIKFALTLAVIAGLAGCATTSDIDKLEDKLRADINQANQTADSASATANAASREASEAKAIAEEARATAEEANSKIDNMFKKSMYK
jgi:F0F1-type ATP synthase membrane subunit b/b'